MALTKVSFSMINGAQFNVRDYGAVGDGTTNDAPAIQAAIDAAELANGGVVYFPRPSSYYGITARLRVKKSIKLMGEGDYVPVQDSDYTTDTPGSPTHVGVTIVQKITNLGGLLIQQDPVATYKILVQVENILFVGEGTGAAANGIEVDAGDVNFHAQCLWKNVAVTGFAGYGVYLKQGYYGSNFENIQVHGNGKTGFYAVGTSQGEFIITNLRAFQNGSTGVAASDKCGLYIASGGSGIVLNRISCTENSQVQLFCDGVQTTIINPQIESFFGGANNSGLICIRLANWRGSVIDPQFTPGTNFLGRIIDLSNVTFCTISNASFYSTVNASGFYVHENASGGYNTITYNANTGSIYTNLTDTTLFGRTTEIVQQQRIKFNRLAQSVILQITASGGNTQHRWYDALSISGAQNTSFATGFNSINDTLTTTPDGANATTAFANGCKINSAATNQMIIDTADLVDGAGIAAIAVNFNSTTTALLATQTATNVNVNGVTRTRLTISFTNAATGVAFDLTGVGNGTFIEVAVNTWLPIY